LRCGKTAELDGWQCRSCFAQFGEPTESELPYVIRLFEEEERWLSKVADRLDGAGYWAAAKAAWRAVDRVQELLAAITERRRGGAPGG